MPAALPKVSPRRGRPPKFGRPSQVVALTLPQDVLDRLKSIHTDPGWAIVQMVEGAGSPGPIERHVPPPAPPVELVHLPGGKALIVVQPSVFRHLDGVSLVPLSDGRAFLAFDCLGGIADLEVAIIDRLQEDRSTAEQAALEQVRDLLRLWRRSGQLRFETKSIIVVNGRPSGGRRPLPKLQAHPKGVETRNGRRRSR